MPDSKPFSPPDLQHTEHRLLQSVVETARQIFGAAASSVFLIDPDSGRLVFEAVAGEGEGERHLIGTSFPAGTGIAGWVAASGQTMVVDDVATAIQFAHREAEETGYLPQSIMAAPLIRHGECMGVLEVLDPSPSVHSSLDSVDLLSMFATQASCGLELLLRLRATSGTTTPVRNADVIIADVGARVNNRTLQSDHPALTLLGVVDRLLDLDP